MNCWGYNGHGQLGDGTTTDSVVPVSVAGLASGVLAVTAGEAQTCAVTSAGGAMCWGRNSFGELGDGTTTSSDVPVGVSGLASGVAAVATGGGHTCALTDAGGVKCWGTNFGGQLGDGTNIDRTTPVGVVGLSSGVVAVSAGPFHTCALTEAGGVKCWGSNFYGQLGDGTTSDRNAPTDVLGLGSGVAAVTVGGFHTCAVTARGGVRCWGASDSGQLGAATSALCPGFLGTRPCSTSAVGVFGLASGAASVDAGALHTCALMLWGSVKCWGSNIYGQLGDGTSGSDNQSATPVDVVGLSSGIAAIAAGGLQSCALTAAGDMTCWGRNEFGQLGDGQSCGLECATPVDVAGVKATPTPCPPNGCPTPSPTITPTPTSPPQPTGDASCDGVVNSTDAALILQLEAGLIASLPCAGAADVNDDGNVDSLDATLILQFDVGLINTL